MKGLLALAARSKSKGAPADKAGAPSPAMSSASLEGEEESDGGSVDAFAREVFGALRDGDEAGFVEALKGAMRACKPESDDSTEV